MTKRLINILLFPAFFMAFAPTASVWGQPSVTLSETYARGNSMAFFRAVFKANGSTISRRGLCYSDSTSSPTISDSTSRLTLSNNGVIYYIKDMKPATVYYVRAFAVSKDSLVGYSDALKVITLPEATVSYEMRSGGEDEGYYDNINSACQTVCDWWNRLTSIKGYHSSVGYNSGTPTADCSYGGWVRVGPNTSYQKAGTILHEWLHGVGVGTHYFWYNNADMRGGATTGLWLGDRVAQAIQFIENNSSVSLTGDATHMWATGATVNFSYGINGSWEDAGTDIQYIANSLVCQALGEDGLPLTSGVNFAAPCYQFEQDDGTKYYIKNESADRGLYNSFLYDNNGTLLWKAAAADNVTDSSAWYITFDPSTQYYQFRNVATGRYITCLSTGFKTTVKAAATSAEDMQLLRGRVDVADGRRGYYIVCPNTSMTPPTLYALASGRTGTASYDVGTDAVTQRWLITTIDEVAALDSALKSDAAAELEEAIDNVSALLDTPHKENTAGSDDTFTQALAEARAAINGEDATAADIQTLITDVMTAAKTFLSGVAPTDSLNPFDLTFMISDASMDSGEGWTGEAPTVSYSCGEFYQKTYNMYQILTGMPAGDYAVRVQGFQRPGSTDDVYSSWQSGSTVITAQLYGTATGTGYVKIKNICDDASGKSLGGSEKSVGDNYVPNDMLSASEYFEQGLYDNVLYMSLTKEHNLRFGVRSTKYVSMDWSIFDNFRLYYYGAESEDETGAIGDTPAAGNSGKKDLYDLNGRRIGASTPPHGIYIRDGKKIAR